jgi:hypothetical protein
MLLAGARRGRPAQPEAVALAGRDPSVPPETQTAANWLEQPRTAEEGEQHRKLSPNRAKRHFKAPRYLRSDKKIRSNA